LTKYCKLSLEDPHLAWRSHTVRALVIPFLCSPMILGLPFLAHNNLVTDYNARTVFDKSCNFDLLHPVVPNPVPPVILPAKRRLILFKAQQDLLKLKKEVFAQAASLARNHAKFSRFTVPEFPLHCFNVVAAIRSRVEALEHISRLEERSNVFKSEFADVFTPIAHTSLLPDDFTCSI
ncbi:hypothetical protein F5050DRAFT_1545256, partial [Lentinula boryana]